VKPYRTYVLRRDGRWTADVPGAFAILCGVAFATGIGMGITDDPTLAAVVWGCLAATAVLGALWWRGYRALRWDLTVDERGVRLATRAGKAIDLGRPRAVTHGKHSLFVSAGTRGRTAPLLWVAVEAADGRTVVFQRAMGILDAVPAEWPAEAPPRTTDVFSSVGFDPVVFRAFADQARVGAASAVS
jgi:hypothetical protein